MDTEQKLNILSDSSKYDLACSCRLTNEPGRLRGQAGRWIYPAVLPDGRKTFLLKVLQSNKCINDCKYCPFNDSRDIQRVTLESSELASVFMELFNAGRVEGLFLSSGVNNSVEKTMEKMLDTVRILRKRHQFQGFIHLKIIPGCSDEAICQAVHLATRVSVNIEAPNAGRLSRLSIKKNFDEGIINTIKKINQYRQNVRHYCGQTTQFVVGAAGESDAEIIKATDRLYTGYEMERVYYSAYQSPVAEPVRPEPGTQLPLFADIPLTSTKTNASFIREHRLYQTDFLLRKYGFSSKEIPLDESGNLSLEKDPKLVWAQSHTGFFPLDINKADYYEILRVPGIGPVQAKRIVKHRKEARLNRQNISGLGLKFEKLSSYIKL